MDANYITASQAGCTQLESLFRPPMRYVAIMATGKHSYDFQCCGMFTRVPAPSRLPCITAPDTDENGLGMEARAVLVRGRNHIALSWLLLMTPCSFVSRGTPLHLSRTSQTLHNLDRCPREVLCGLSHPQESTESSICRQSPTDTYMPHAVRTRKLLLQANLRIPNADQVCLHRHRGMLMPRS